MNNVKDVTAKSSEIITPESKHTKTAPYRESGQKHLLLNFLSAFPLGATVGLLTGLSLSPVVASVLSGLLTLIITLASLPSQNKQPASQVQMMLRMSGFGIGIVLFLIIGIWMRTHNSLSPSFKTQTKQLVKIGVSKSDARELIIEKNGFQVSPITRHIRALRSVGVSDNDLKPLVLKLWYQQASQGVAENKVNTLTDLKTGLMGNKTKPNTFRNDLNPANFDEDKELVKAYELAGDKWTWLVQVTEKLDIKNRVDVLKSAWIIEKDSFESAKKGKQQ